jgi:hypothetical protein
MCKFSLSVPMLHGKNIVILIKMIVLGGGKMIVLGAK